MPDAFRLSAEIPQEVRARLEAWRRLFMQSTVWHKTLGVLGVAAATLATLDFEKAFGESYAVVPRLLAALSAISVAILTSFATGRVTAVGITRAMRRPTQSPMPVIIKRFTSVAR